MVVEAVVGDVAVEVKMKKLILFSLVLSLIGIASAQQYACPMFGGSYGTGAMLLNWLVYTLIIITLIAAIYWLIKSADKVGKGR